MLQEYRYPTRTGALGVGAATAVALLVGICQPSGIEYWGQSYGTHSRRTGSMGVNSGLGDSTASRVRLITKEVPTAPVWAEPIASIRSSCRVTVLQVAEALNVTRQTMHAWQSGRKEPSSKNKRELLQLASAGEFLERELGVRLSLHLELPLENTGMTFFELIKSGTSAMDAAQVLVSSARRMDAHRADLQYQLNDILPEQPLDDFV